jgi:hypothetical protein
VALAADERENRSPINFAGMTIPARVNEVRFVSFEARRPLQFIEERLNRRSVFFGNFVPPFP